MSATSWSFYNRARKYISGTINLGSGTFDLHLFTSASNFATVTISTLGSLTSQVSSASGYTTAGKQLASVTWSTGASAKQIAFNAAAVVQSAIAGTISNIKGAVIVARTGASAKATANKLLCFSTLSSSQFSISSGNTLTITPAATGIFTLAGA